MISTPEIAIALSLVILIAGHVSFLALRPKPVRIPVRVRDARSRRRPHA